MTCPFDNRPCQPPRCARCPVVRNQWIDRGGAIFAGVVMLFAVLTLIGLIG